MDLIQLMLYTYADGKEVKHLWSFTPLRNVLVGPTFAREATTGGSNQLRRRAYNRQEVRQVTLPAGLLLNDSQFDNLNRLLNAHKIEWLRSVGGKNKWIEFTLDVEAAIEYETVEDIDRLIRYSFKLVQSDPVWFTDFESKSAKFTDYGGR